MKKSSPNIGVNVSPKVATFSDLIARWTMPHGQKGLADILHTTPQSVYRWEHAGQSPTLKQFQGTFRYLPLQMQLDVLRWLTAGTQIVISSPMGELVREMDVPDQLFNASINLVELQRFAIRAADDGKVDRQEAETILSMINDLLGRLKAVAEHTTSTVGQPIGAAR